MGIIFAFLALVSWGFGDFLIQRSARRFGDWTALFFISMVGTIGLLPFAWKGLSELSADPRAFWMLLGTSAALLVAALLEFEALRVGKLSVIESVWVLEVPVTAVLSAGVLGERLSVFQVACIAAAVFGIVLVSTKSFAALKLKEVVSERGVWLAVLAALSMGTVNFLFGVSARETDPMVINWFTSAFLAVATFAYLWRRGSLGEMVMRWRTNRRLVLSVGIIDNLAWVFFASSMLFIPIAVATGISEGYIALAALLGLAVNRERLTTHQLFGLVLAVAGAIALAATETF